MAEVNSVFDRDKRGEWQPSKLPTPSEAFKRPLKLSPILKALFGRDEVIWPQNTLYMALAVVSWLYLTPEQSRTNSFALGWIAEIYVRNATVLLLIAGSLHLRLYVQKSQGQRHKFNHRWLSTRNRAFLFGNQTWDNIFWNFVSGCTIWSGFEAVTLWAYSNNMLLWGVDWHTNPIYCTLLMVGVIFLRVLHFYWTHRITHWKPLYRAAHYVHHKNVNVGPWSGLAMHPIEHLFYFSGVFIHWILPSHPIHAIFHLMHAGLSPANGHSGFDQIEVNNQPAIKSGDYFHYLHHRYFDCNYGVPMIPLDQWFGSFHDGSPEAHKAMRVRQRRLKLGNQKTSSKH